MSAPAVRLVVSDVDGTLVKRDKTLSARTIRAVERLRDHGITFAITSSRPPRGLAHLVAPLGLTTALSGFNGGAIVSPELEELETRVVPEPMVREAVDALTAAAVDVWLFTGRDWLVRNPMGAYVDHEAFTLKFGPTVVKSFEPHMGAVAKLVGSSKDFGLLARCESALKAQLDGANVARSQQYYLDITHAEANKGSVVRMLGARHGVPREATLVLGDMRNDLPMFAAAGFSVAMGQAADDVKAAASVVTDTNEQDGFAKAIERHVFGDTVAEDAA